MRFEIGQQVVCVRKGNWRRREDYTIANGPNFNEVVTVKEQGERKGDIVLVEYAYDSRDGRSIAFDERAFQPLVSDAVLAEELSQITETVE
jgi:hypothetical protein